MNDFDKVRITNLIVRCLVEVSKEIQRNGGANFAENEVEQWQLVGIHTLKIADSILASATIK